MLVQMFPLILALIPLFIIFKDAGLINTYYSVILVYTLLNLPFATWMFEGFFDAIPRELEEAASVDGCTRFGTLTRIVVPLSGPGTAAVTIFTFLLCYNEFLIASIFLRDPDTMTIPVGIQMFMQAARLVLLLQIRCQRRAVLDQAMMHVDYIDRAVGTSKEIDRSKALIG